MKKFLLTLGLAALTAFGARADGTIGFNNNVLSRVTTFDGTSSVYVNSPFYVAVYWSADGINWNNPAMPFGVGPNFREGFFTVPNGAAYAIPGTDPFQTVSMQVYAWFASYGDDPYAAWEAGSPTASTGVRQITLGPEIGPGTLIWQSATGTNPNRFTPLQFGLARPAPPLVPEPSTLALAALCGLALLWRSRSILQRRPAQ